MTSADFTASETTWMSRALRLARRGLYTTRPNPRVGCVLTSRGNLVGEGWHVRAGEPHAEVLALRQAGSEAVGATAFVTLEPCSHHGRTPPCCDALIESGVAEVIVAMVDPNPRVAGTGLARLSSAGLTVRSGLLTAGARELNPGYVRRMTTGRPWVRVKLAASLDGRSAMASGESRWITGTDARRDVHRLRARSCAIVSGIGTVLADDPALTVRDVTDASDVPPPLRVILDPDLRMSPRAAMLSQPGRTLVFTRCADAAPRRALERAGAEVGCLAAGKRGLDLPPVLDELGSREVNEVLVEAGPSLAGAFLREGLVDELIIYHAPHLMGDAARPLLRLPGLDRMEQRLGLVFSDVRRIGDDLRLILHPRQRDSDVE